MLVTVITLVSMLLLNPARTEAKMQQYPRLPAAGRHDRVLIVAPHIDDEAIGAGGYAIDAIANGAEVFVVFLTAGDCNRFSARLMHRTLEPTTSNYLAVGRTRISEARDAMHILGLAPDHYFVLGYPDRGLRSMMENRNAIVRSLGTGETSVPYGDAVSPGALYNYASLMSDIKKIIDFTRPTMVIAPVPFDLHPDHTAAAQITDEALDQVSLRPSRLGYLVHAGRMTTALMSTPTRALLPPSRMQAFSWTTYGLSDQVQQKKTEVLLTYKSQRPYLFLLRNRFIRRNELFFQYPQLGAAPLASAPRHPIAR
ncbi:MAG: PIG-L family deacetylase [Thermoanaerobaculia bacterium]